MTIPALLLWVPVLLCACGDGDGASALAPDVSAVYLGEGEALDGTEDGTGNSPGETEGSGGTHGQEPEGPSGGAGSAPDENMSSNQEGTAAEGDGMFPVGSEGAASPGQNGASGEGAEGNGAEGTGLPEGAGGPAPSSEVSVTISAAGDVTMGNYVGQGYEVSFRQTYDQGAGDDYFFENVKDIFSADDLTLVNLEGPLTYSEDFREGQTYCISGDPEYVNILTAGSVEAVGMGNNHRLDYKEQGTADTVAALEGAGILYAYDGNYCMYEAKGIRIGIVSVNEVGQGAGVERYLQEGIAKLREEGADLVLACCHWGIEREYYPEDYQKSLGRKCIDWGYDLVIGHHPHVLQGIEEYQGKFILYSLGNFCFGANRNPPDKDCMIFQQTFTFVDGVKQEDAQIRVIPCSVSSTPSRNDYKPTPAQGEESQRILDRINEFSLEMGVRLDSEGYLAD